ncbi:MAG: hypothetical protein K6A33_10365 [Clostridiales bacterium]|nr:hypothetical protein [Clostridiales bacterium]
MKSRKDKAFEAMRESNRLYLEDMRKKEGGEAGYDPSLTPEEIEELKAAEEKARAFREENGKAESVWRSDTWGSGVADTIEDGERKAREFHREENVPLEKGDVSAMILSALLVFGPIFLVLAGIIALAWFFLH